MNRTHLSRIAGAGLLALSLSMIPLTLPASAQTNSTTTNSDKTTLDTTPFQETKNDGDHNFGWLGLLGLIGLANLLRKDKPRAHQVERYAVGSTTTRY